jgi:protein SCO1/2
VLEVAQLEPDNRLPDFTLTRAAGPLTPAGLRGRWSFVFFGYTNCPNACPATLGILNHVQESLRAQGLEPPRIVFISLDPQRDTPAVLQRYAAAFGDDVVGATGNEAALHALLEFFGVSAERQPGTDAASYTLDHTTNFFLVTPDGRWLATFPPAEDGEAVLADTQTLIRLPTT